MGIQASSLPTEEVERPKGAIDFSLGAYAGWELVEQNAEGCPGRAHTVVLEHGGMSYILIFISDSTDQEPTFQAILATLALPDG
jgi:hypothetical protein